MKIKFIIFLLILSLIFSGFTVSALANDVESIELDDNASFITIEMPWEIFDNFANREFPYVYDDATSMVSLEIEFVESVDIPVSHGKTTIVTDGTFIYIIYDEVIMDGLSSNGTVNRTIQFFDAFYPSRHMGWARKNVPFSVSNGIVNHRGTATITWGSAVGALLSFHNYREFGWGTNFVHLHLQMIYTSRHNLTRVTAGVSTFINGSGSVFW